MAIVDEPVRGSTPPAWWWSLPGLERIQVLARGLIPRPPLSRLLGSRAGHVGPAFCTWTMPATGWLTGSSGEMELSSFVEAALTSTAMTAVGPAQTVEPLTLATNHFRPVRPTAGNLVARCRVINASRFFVYTEAEVEDPSGRQLLHASSHAAIRPVTPDPPPAPAELKPAEEPVFSTPDPCLRPVTVDVHTETEIEGGIRFNLLKNYADGVVSMPYSEFLGYRVRHAEIGEVSGSVPSSEWFCLYSNNVSHGVLASIGNATGTGSGQTLNRPGESFVGLVVTTRFYDTTRADGRFVTVDTTSHLRSGDRASVEVVSRDPEANVLATTWGVAHFVDAAKRQRVTATPTKRMLCSLLFTDIVGSTEHAEGLGDQQWHALLEEQRKRIRAEIARCNGAEIDTAGDGFFVRFDSPADALDCAVAAIHAVKPLGIEIRAGVHTGECEVTGRNYAGMAVHMGARIMATAGPSEVLVSSTVHDLVMGSGRTFEDRGEHQLKGVPGTWRLHALV